MSDNEGGYEAFPTYTTRSRNGNRFFLVFIIIFVLAAIILGGLYFLGSSENSSKENSIVVRPTSKIEATATPLPTSSASAVLTVSVTGVLTPAAKISSVDGTTKLDRSKLAVAVLNGSGVAGAALGVSNYLEGLGYNIVKVDNANAFTYTNLTVQVKKSKSGYAGLLKKDLEANPELASVSASISDDISNEAEVIVGK